MIPTIWKNPFYAGEFFAINVSYNSEKSDVIFFPGENMKIHSKPICKPILGKKLLYCFEIINGNQVEKSCLVNQG